MHRRQFADRLPAETWFVGSAVFHYLGPAFAVLLFVRVGPLGTGWLRIAAAALVLFTWRRPAGLLRDPLLIALGAVRSGPSPRSSSCP
jgi:inner membrane transporter RhtA